MIAVQDYVSFLGKEYLDGFIAGGGAAVKFMIAPEPEAAGRTHELIRRTAEDKGYLYAHVDAASVKVHMIDHVFFAVARQMPWVEMANRAVTEVLKSLKFPRPEDGTLSLSAIARYNNYDFNELRRDFNRRLQEQVFKDYDLAEEFRIAMLRLCQAAAEPNAHTETTQETVLEWLRGELRLISRLKQDLIFQKIARHNARHMLFSLAGWTKKVGYSGLVLDLDIRQCMVAKRSETDGVHYTKPATMDVYEVLRQLIDSTDELNACFSSVVASNDFLTDPARGVEAYQALKLRIWDEVKDRNRVNPYSALIRLTADSGSRSGGAAA